MKPEQPSVAVERLSLHRNGKIGELGGRQHGIVGHPGLRAAADDLQRIAHGDCGQNLDGLGQRWSTDNAARLYVAGIGPLRVALFLSYYRGFFFGFVTGFSTCFSNSSRSPTLYSR